jgi:hypothetical protein
MAIEKQTAIDQIEVLEGGTVQIRRAVWLVEDGQRTQRLEFIRAAKPSFDALTEEERAWLLQRIGHA